MNNNLKYILCAGVFLLCVGIGFLATRLGKDDTQKEVGGGALSAVPESKVQSPSVVTADSLETNTKVDEKKERQAPVKMVTKEVKKKGNLYTLRVTCINIPENVTIQYEIPALGKKSTDGVFTKIPGCKTASYIVNVVNAQTKDVLLSEAVSGFVLIDDAQVDKMTAGQFQALLLNQNDNSLLGGKHPKIARNVTLTFTGLQDGEKRPNDILAVREKIAFGIWSSARVLQVGYDENGRINSARIQPVY